MNDKQTRKRKRVFIVPGPFESDALAQTHTHSHIHMHLLKKLSQFSLNVYFYATMRADPLAKYDERNKI